MKTLKFVLAISFLYCCTAFSNDLAEITLPAIKKGNLLDECPFSKSGSGKSDGMISTSSPISTVSCLVSTVADVLGSTSTRLTDLSATEKAYIMNQARAGSVALLDHNLSNEEKLEILRDQNVATAIYLVSLDNPELTLAQAVDKIIESSPAF